MTSDQNEHGPSSAQALSDSLKEAVKSWVPKVRKALDDEFGAQLERLGLRRNGKHVALDKMSLPSASVAVRHRAEALVARESLSEGTPERGYDNVVRELTYTLLNRLVGLKAMEARKLLYLPPPGDANASPEETEVITPVPGQARSRYLRDFRAAGGSRYKYEDDAEEALLREGLTSAFRHVTSEIRVLFDPDHEYASVWPTHAALTGVLKMINEDLPADAYRAQDFLGWVYQFFNRDEKKRVRDENKGTPRSSYELAVINQFYTPSWVVKALVDNTLGRLWVEMHPDTAIHRVSPEGTPSYQIVPATQGAVAEQRPVSAPKLARDIALLDPACGAMHFGQYAFSLFYRMYEEELERCGQPGWPAEPSVSSPADIPAAILENNLFGIDIDPRAIQIAALSLLLTAKEAALSHGVSLRSVRVRRSNLVVANGVSLGESSLKTLVDRIGVKLGSDELRQRLFQTLWDTVRNVGELGSLVQVGEGMSRVLDEWVQQQAKARGLTKVARRRPTPQLELGSIISDANRLRAHQLELERQALHAEAVDLQRELLQAVDDASAATAAAPSERLFAEDTGRSLKLIQTLSRKFDVVVMNPPYGSPTKSSAEYIDNAYPLGRNDIYCAFVERGLALLTEDGYLGALTSRAFFSGPRSLDFRTALLGEPFFMPLLLDLGSGILDDATVSTAAYVVTRKRCGEVAVLDLVCDGGEREMRLRQVLSGDARWVYRRSNEFFLAIADRRLAYNLLPSLEKAFVDYPPLFPEYLEDAACVGRKNFAPQFAAVVQGIIPVPLEWFVRQRWEVRGDGGATWIPLAKGGDFGRFWYDEDLVIDWSSGGARVKSEAKRRYGSASRTIKNDGYFGRRGLTFPRVSSIGFSCRPMPDGAGFTDKGQLIFLASSEDLSPLMAVLNSELILVTLLLLNPSRFTEVNDLAILPVPRKMPRRLGEIAERMVAIKREWAAGLEPSREFVAPHLARVDGDTLAARLENIQVLERSNDDELQALYSELNEVVESLYQLAPADVEYVRNRCSSIARERVWAGMQTKTAAQRRLDLVWRLLSFAVKRVIDADDDGIVPFNRSTGETPLAERVRVELAALFPERDESQIEVEIVNELKRGAKGYRKCTSLDDWLANAFFEYHASVYNGRPIYWHIASAQGISPFAFGALVHYHRFDKNRMQKLRASYVRDTIEELRRDAGLADKAGRADDRVELQAKLEEAQALDRKLQLIQEGHHEGAEGGDRDFRILTPWKEPAERPKGWDPDLDDGVKVNIAPLDRACILRVSGVAG